MGDRCSMQLAKMSTDPKFAELTVDVARILLRNIVSLISDSCILCLKTQYRGCSYSVQFISLFFHRRKRLGRQRHRLDLHIQSDNCTNSSDSRSSDS